MTFFITAILLIAITFFVLRHKLQAAKAARKNNNSNERAQSLPAQYAYCFIIWSAIFLLIILSTIGNKEFLSKIIALFSALILCAFLTIYSFRKRFNAKIHLEKTVKFLLILSTLCGIVITALIVISIFFEAIKFFKIIPPAQFLFGTKWNPQVAVYQGQSLSDSSFGMLPVLCGTLLITCIAIAVAVPVGIGAAIYLSHYASSKIRNLLKPVLEILAGVPTVVYGYFAVVSVAPFLQNNFAALGINIASESALAAGLVMGVMIIPFILSLSEDSLSAVPLSLKDGALAMGSTKSEMIKKVVIPTALPSIISSVLLAISRAIGETMIVVMAAGLVANLTFNPGESVTTATAQIVTLLVGDQESDSPKTLAAFALGMVLFLMTLVFNIIALIVVKKYKEKYE